MAARGRQIWTIGYEHATVAAVLGALRDAGIALVADVRALPLSRRPGFSKTGLAAALAEAGLAYRHWRALGTPPEGRAAARRGDREALARIYAEQLELPEATAAVAGLRAEATARRTALLCYERDAAGCHRRLLATRELGDFTAVDLVPRPADAAG